MTRDEAINFFESLKDCLDKTVPALSPQLGKAIYAIKSEQQKIKLDMSMWNGCGFCYRWTTMGNGPAYCRDCGKPLNDEALEELERRINGE